MNSEIDYNLNECLTLLKSSFQLFPSGDSGLSIEMPEIEKKLKKERFPIESIGLEDFERYYPFCHVSQGWAGYLGAVFAYKMIQNIMSENFHFLNGPILQNFLYLFESDTISLEALAEDLSRKQRVAFGTALDCIIAGVPSRAFQDKRDLSRLLNAIEKWSLVE